MEQRNNLYDTDFFLWCKEQSALVLKSESKEMDKENIAEELESMGKSDKRSIKSYIRIILIHMIKLKIQPNYEGTRGWDISINNARSSMGNILKDSPSLRRMVPEYIEEEWPKAVSIAAEETHMSIRAIPVDRPFTIEEVLGDKR